MTPLTPRWDFPIRYDGNGVDEMWVDRLFFEESFAKAEAPPAGCLYRIVLIPQTRCAVCFRPLFNDDAFDKRSLLP